MTYRHRSELLLLGLVLLWLPTGCTTGHGGSNTASSANTLRYPMTTEPTDLDPARVQDGTTIDLLQNIFEGLVKWDEHSQVTPALAEKWDVSADGKTYTFHLRHGVKFHNGREVTAEDVKYSFDRACDPNTKSQTVSDYLNDIVGAADCYQGKAGVKGVAGVKVVDPLTVQITIDAPKSYWLGKLTYPTGYVVCKEAIEKNGNVLDEKSAIGTGPFKIAPEDFQRGYQAALTANDSYYAGRPKLDRIVRPIIKEGSTRLSKYEAGELDFTPISPADLDHVNGDPKLKPDLKQYSRAATWYLALNQDAPGSPFTSKPVRLAFAHAIDKKEVIRVALKDMVKLADGVVPPGLGAYTSIVTPIPFDPAKAKELLAQAGYGPGGKPFPTLTLTYRNDQPEVNATAQVVANQLKTNLGIDVQCKPMEWAEFLKQRDAKTLALSHLRWSADYLDPQDFLSVLLHTSKTVNGHPDHPENGVGYSNAEFDKLCDQADIEQNADKRMKLYQQAEQIAVQDAPWVPLYFQQDLELDRPTISNIRDSLLGHLPYTTTTVK